MPKGWVYSSAESQTLEPTCIIMNEFALSAQGICGQPFRQPSLIYRSG